MHPEALVAAAIARCDTSTVHDDSGLKGPRIVAEFSAGDIVGSPT
jgi:predicted ABC-type ATPase